MAPPGSVFRAAGHAAACVRGETDCTAKSDSLVPPRRCSCSRDLFFFYFIRRAMCVASSTVKTGVGYSFAGNLGFCTE